MLFYVALGLASVIVAIVTLWLFRSLYSIGKTAYQSILPSSRREEAPQSIRLITTLGDTPTPWGWRNLGRPRQITQVHAPTAPETQIPVPWGWPGGNMRRRSIVLHSLNNHLNNKRTHGTTDEPDRPVVGWPYRQESFEFAGRKYRVERPMYTPVPTGGELPKPWGW